MCITAIAWRLFADKPLVLLSNRDEFFARPTLPLHQWPSGIIAGQDKTAGGTWLGFNPQNGHWGVLLNFREIVPNRPVFNTSRGQILVDFLASECTPLAFARQLDLQSFDGFNLVIGNREQAIMLNNQGFGIEVLANGLYVLSNGQPNDDWFKCERLRGRVRQEVLPLIAEHQAWHDAAFNVLSDTLQAPHERLPKTGLPVKAELALSSIFIPKARMQSVFGQPYGTRVSSSLTLRQNGFEFLEKQTLTGEIKQIHQLSV